MIHLRQRVIQQFGVLLTVALLLVPLALSGHRHNAGQSSPADACALCVAVHYSPATTTPPLPQLAPPRATVATTVPSSAPLIRLCQVRPSGRAPPQSVFFHAV